jgi:mannose-6-phosphate isomerase-like protein (cupin superfamily)
MPVISQDQLPWSVIAHEFVGEDHGGVGICFLLVEAPPGTGPALHQHPYEEVILIQEGRGIFTIGDEQLELGAGQVAIIPRDTPHAFTNTGDGPLRQVDIHVSPRFATEWLT